MRTPTEDEWLNARIEAEVARRMERHNLQQAHQRLRDAKAAAGRAKALDLPIEAVAIIEGLTLKIEDAMWKIEQMVGPKP
jgi:hypothetical protein